jgi:hypothetical protein
MPITYNETALWQRTLGSTGNNPREESAIAALRSTFETAHTRIKPIVRQAHLDCAGLTIHDESHLDALWQLANTISGDQYEINPLEAFVFGCSVLFHDSALAVAAYEGGLDALKATPEWQRAMIQAVGTTNIQSLSLSPDQTKQVESTALFAVVRSLHGKQAANIGERQWERPDDHAPIHILEDTELRDYYGQIIGRIAQSHHWDIDRVAREFVTRKAPPPNLPEEWELNELKVALLLRCADAAHIDQRRAPLMDYILARPKGVSALHWGFQSKIGVPKRGDRSIIYNSGRDFGRSEADAWWLCFDTCKMISSELENAAAVLKEADTDAFFASRVEGAQRPKLFARYVHCDGWEPVDAEVRVTDPIGLAQTLGGRNLYGAGYQAPIRELLQNAIDATKLRGSIGREGYVPKVRLTLEPGERGHLKITVEDNGIGMSERVLTRRLLDFGRSGWKSDDVTQENPEVSLANVKISGKFGIGFFSVFLLGDDVSVITRRYNDGIGDGLALEFVGLSRRPILRKASSDEQSDVYTTKIIVNISDQIAIRSLSPAVEPVKVRSRRPYGQLHHDVFQYLKWLVASAEVDIDLVDKVSDRSFKHSSNWLARASEEFIRDITGKADAQSHPDYAALYSDSLRNVVGDAGAVIGRAAIVLGRESRARDVSFATVGGLTYPARMTVSGTSNTNIVPPFIGVMEGEAAIATRGQAELAVSSEALARWATDQALIASSLSLATLEKMELARSVYWAGGDPSDLPIGYFDGKNLSISQFKAILEKSADLFLPVNGSGRSEYIWYSLGEIRARFFLDRMSGSACVFALTERESVITKTDDEDEITFEVNAVLPQDIRKRISFGSYDILIDIIEKSGRDFTLRYEYRDIFDDGLVFGKLASGIALVFEK